MVFGKCHGGGRRQWNAFVGRSEDHVELDALNLLDNVSYGSRFVVPFVIDEQCLGVLYGYTSRERELSSREMQLLHAISTFGAATIAHRLLLDLAHGESPIRALFDDLLANKPPDEEILRPRFVALGFDVAQPSVMVLVEPACLQQELENKPLVVRLLDRIHTGLSEHFPSALAVMRELQACAIIPLARDDASHLDTWLKTLVQDIESESPIRFAAGISAACYQLRDYARGFIDAREALEIGRTLHNHAGSLRIDRLAPYRYLLPFARQPYLGGDVFLDHIQTLTRYDHEHKRGNLLRSLEIFLALGGNIKDASEHLKVHRNTLTQRLDRIQSLCHVNLDSHHERLALQMAIMIFRLRHW
jgi:sugar diacid utilization regulator